MAHLQIVIGSLRARRIGDQIGTWACELLSEQSWDKVELVDLADWPLPMDDEPDQPKHGHPYAQAHTQAFSELISKADAYVFLCAQYNWGYPAALKNALDHLYHEWNGKPALIVSYGARGGVKAAAQLRDVLKGLHMRPVEVDVNLVLKPEYLGEDRRLISAAAAFSPESAKLAAGGTALLAALSEA